MTEKIPRKDQICSNCNKKGVLAKGLCGSCYNKKWQKEEHKPKIKKESPIPTATYNLPDGVFEAKDGLIYMDRNIEFNYNDPKILAIQYKACVYQTATIILIIRNLFPDIESAQIKNWIGRYSKFYNFRKTGGYLERDKFYKEQEMKAFANKTPINDNPFKYDNSTETDNRPLLNQRHRIEIGKINKLDKMLLYAIRNHKKNAQTHNYFSEWERSFIINNR